MNEVDDWQRFWKWEYAYAFRLYFERKEASHKESLLKALRAIPANRAQIDYVCDFPGERLIVAFTHDRDNDGAAINEAQIMTILAKTRALTFFGIAGANVNVNVDFSEYQSYDDATLLQEVAFAFLGKHILYPIEYVAMFTRPGIDVWGIEDPEIYQLAVESVRKDSNDIFDLVPRRSPILVQNLLATMHKVGVLVAGVWLTSYDFNKAHAILSELQISHIGVRSRDEGPTDWGREQRYLRTGVLPLDELLDSGTRRWYHRVRDLPLLGSVIVDVGRATNKMIWEWFRPLPKSLSEAAARMQIRVFKQTCELCGSSFGMPERQVVVPVRKRNILLELDLGGHCERCGYMMCANHAQALISKRQGRPWMLAGCEQCGGALAGSSS